MRPRGFEDAVAFKHARKFPLGSMKDWIDECYSVVETRFHFACSWETLVGMTAGLIFVKPTLAKYIHRIAVKSFKRPNEERFLMYFLALVDALTGASDAELQVTYRGTKGRSLRKAIPASVIEWPHSYEKRNGSHILADIRPEHSTLPATRESTSDFYVYLLYGYYVTSGDERALECLFDEYTNTPASGTVTEKSLVFDAVFLDNEQVRQYFHKRGVWC